MSQKNFTSHGHPIPGAPYRPDQQPRNVARCGGPGLCPDCSREAGLGNRKNRMTTIDHQQAAIDAAAEAWWRRDYPEYGPWQDAVAERPEWASEIRADCAAELTAATPHLRAGMADELLDDTPGSPLTRGYQRLMDPKPGEHPVRTWEAAVRVMLDTLLEGGAE